MDTEPRPERNGYQLTRTWFNFMFESHECKHVHAVLYTWLIELNNRFGWKECFGLPTAHTMECLKITNKRTYYDALHDLERWGFVKIVELSKNRYTSTIISLPMKEKPGRQPLDRAIMMSGEGEEEG